MSRSNVAGTLMIGIMLFFSASFANGQGYGKSDGPAAAGNGGEIAAPTALHLRIVPNGFQLEWTLSPQDPGAVTGYEIVRSDRFSGPYDTVATVEKGMALHIDTTASKEIIYFYKVRAIAGKAYSSFSNTVTGER